MKKIEKYTGNKTYMFPNGAIATPELIKKDFPAVEVFSHIIETDSAGEVCFAVQNLNAMRSMYNIPMEIEEDEAIARIQDIINTPLPEQEASAEERIAAALEFLNLLSM